VSLDQVADRRSGKRNRLHLDLYTSDQESEVERLIKLGAKRYPWKYQPDDDFIKLEDPDGNDFCVVQKAATEALGAGRRSRNGCAEERLKLTSKTMKAATAVQVHSADESPTLCTFSDF
jgi:Glyoxalase-like domain